jgi:hypothetical protein
MVVFEFLNSGHLNIFKTFSAHTESTALNVHDP